MTMAIIEAQLLATRADTAPPFEPQTKRMLRRLEQLAAPAAPCHM